MNVITTERLTLEHASEDDSEFILELLNTEDWKRFIGNRNVNTPEDAGNYIRNVLMKSYTENGFGLYVIKLRNENIPIGICGLIKREALQFVDIGFALLPGYYGKGYAYESAINTLNYAGLELGLKQIAAITNKDNHDSIKLLEKLGLKFINEISFPGEEKKLLLYLQPEEK